MTKKLIRIGTKVVKIGTNLITKDGFPTEEEVYVFKSGNNLLKIGENYLCYNLDAPPAELASITTADATSVSNNSAVLGGNVLDDGGATVTERGIYLSETSDPKNSGVKHADGSGTGSFSSTYSNLDEEKTYHFVAYATNSKGTAYGDDKAFTTDATHTATVTVKTEDSGHYVDGIIYAKDSSDNVIAEWSLPSDPRQQSVSQSLSINPAENYYIDATFVHLYDVDSGGTSLEEYETYWSEDDINYSIGRSSDTYSTDKTVYFRLDVGEGEEH